MYKYVHTKHRQNVFIEINVRTYIKNNRAFALHMWVCTWWISNRCSKVVLYILSIFSSIEAIQCKAIMTLN